MHRKKEINYSNFGLGMSIIWVVCIIGLYYRDYVFVIIKKVLGVAFW